MGDNLLMEMFAKVGAIVTGSHIVYTPKEDGWYHGEAYVNKDAISLHPKLLAMCAQGMTRLIRQFNEEHQDFLRSIQVVAAPAAGAVGWGQMLAHRLCDFAVLDPRFVFAEKSPDPANSGDHIFTFRKIFQDTIKDSGVLVAEDITNPGTSAKKVAKAVEACGGKVVGVSVLCNRVGPKAHDYLAPYPLLAVADVTMDMWHEDNCPLCQQGVPLNMDLGKAKDWLATEKGQAWLAAHSQ